MSTSGADQEQSPAEAAGGPGRPPITVTRGGTPTEAEVAAILAAVEALWPRPAPPEQGPAGPSPWRFSGRWWARPVTARRDRPWYVAGS